MSRIFTVWKKELIDNFRDRRTLITAIVMPVVLMPVILIGTFKLQEFQVRQAEEKEIMVGINNAEAAPSLVSFFEAQEAVTLVTADDPETAINEGMVDVFLEVPSTFETQLTDLIPVPVTLYAKSSETDSQTAQARVLAALSIFNQSASVERLQGQGIEPSVLQAVAIEQQDIASAAERGGFFIGLLLPMFIVLFAIVGGMYVAIDVSAGEKERKTLEALLLAPVSRFTLVMGKYLAVTTMASMTIVLSLASMYIAFKVSPPDLGMEFGEIAIDISVGAIAVMLLLGVILAVMFSGLLLSVAIFAKSYKEAQNYISPFYILAVLPVAIANSLPGFEPSISFYLVPGMNAVFVIKEALLGVFDWTHIGITLVSLVIFAAAGIIVASKIYSKEGILFRD